MSDTRRLRIAIQKSGRLSDDSIALLKAIGVKLQIRDRLLIAHSTNEPIDLLRVRDDDIPGLVMDGVADLGFIGENELEEKMLERQAANKPSDFITLRRLDYGGCRLSLAVPNELDYSDVNSLQGKKVATTYPYLLERFFKEKEPTTTIQVDSGLEVDRAVMPYRPLHAKQRQQPPRHLARRARAAPNQSSPPPIAHQPPCSLQPMRY